MTKQRNGLSKTIRWFYGIGDLAFTLMTNVNSYYSAFFLTDVAKLSLASVTFITSVSALIDACTSWVFGAIINSTKPMKWGRYRSWLVAFTWLLPPFYFFQYFAIGSTEAMVTASLFIAVVFSRFIHNFPYVANLTMINIVAKTPDEKILMASNRSTYNNASKFVWSYLSVPFLALLTAQFGAKYSYAILSCLLSFLTIATYWGHFKMFEGYEQTGEEEKASKVKTKRAKTGPMDLIKGLALNPPLLILLLADLGKWCFNFVVAGTVVYYFKYIANDMPAQAWYTLMIAFASVIGSYFSRNIGKVLGAKNTIVIFMIFMGICLFAANAIYDQMWPVIILISLAQLGYGVIYSTSSAMYTDTCVYNEWKTGKNASGWIMGLQNLPLKIGFLVRTIIIAAALATGGFSAAIAPAKTPLPMKKAICMALMTVPGIILIASAAVLFFGYKLTKARVIEMQNEIDDRKAVEEV